MPLFVAYTYIFIHINDILHESRHWDALSVIAFAEKTFHPDIVSPFEVLSDHVRSSLVRWIGVVL